MKILFLYLNAYSFVGGIQKFNQNFLNALSNCADRKNDLITSLSLSDESKDLNNDANIKQFTADKNRKKFLVEAIKLGYKSDVIVFGHINILFPLVIFFKVLTKKKLVLISHGIEVWSDISFLKKISISKLDLIITVSAFTKDKIIKAHQIPQEKVKVLHNTLDPAFKLSSTQEIVVKLRQRLNIGLNDRLLLTVCRVTKGEKHKGYDKVISLLPELLKDFPELKYIIAGKYDEEEKERLTILIKTLNLEDKVILTGYVSDSELPALYEIADLFIMPSKKEGFGIVFLEALKAGKPIIAGNKDGSVDALANGELGLLVDPDNENEIVEAVSLVLKGQAEAKFYNGEFLRDKSGELFGFERFTHRIKDLILTSK